MEKDNLFKRALKGIFSPSTYSRALQKLNGDVFYQIGDFFGYNYGTKEYSRYLKAFASNPLVYMIIHKIAVTTAGIKKKVVDSDGEIVEQSVLAEIMERPNELQGEKEFYETLYEYFCTTGNAFILGVEGLGMGFELKALNPSRMTLNLNSIGEPFSWSYENNKGKVTPYELDEILHIKSSNVVSVSDAGVYFGLSPLEAAWMVVKSSDEILKAEASIFKNRGIIGILTNETDVPMLKGERERLQQEFDGEVGGADRFNKLKISNTKLKYIQTGMSPTDLKLLEGLVSKLRLLCSIYGLSSVLFNDNDNSTYNNVEMAVKASYVDSYLPLLGKIDDEISVWLSGKLEIDEKIVADLTSIEVLKASTNNVAQALSNLSPQVQARIVATMTRDEARLLVELGVLPDSALGEELVGDGKETKETEPKP